jgi:hypothetical protein
VAAKLEAELRIHHERNWGSVDGRSNDAIRRSSAAGKGRREQLECVSKLEGVIVGGLPLLREGETGDRRAQACSQDQPLRATTAKACDACNHYRNYDQGAWVSPGEQARQVVAQEGFEEIAGGRDEVTTACTTARRHSLDDGSRSVIAKRLIAKRTSHGRRRRAKGHGLPCLRLMAPCCRRPCLSVSVPPYQHQTNDANKPTFRVVGRISFSL